MEIINSSIIDLSGSFKSIKKKLDCCNYVVSIDARQFHYSETLNDFSIDDLHYVFGQSKDIVGEINQDAWEDVYKSINYHLNFNNEICSKKYVDMDIISNFWQQMKKYILLPPEIVYRHTPSQGSYFGDFIMWGFCYIFLSQGTGIIIAMEASD